MRTRAKVATSIAAGLLAAAGMFAPAASAATPTDRGVPSPKADQAIANTWVYTWTEANVRSCPYLSCGINYTVGANYRFSAICWDYGQTISQNGYTHNKWVLLGSGQSWVWGGLLKGSETGNVPNRC
ncbi:MULTISPECIES: hypothetical protein [unclassified Streptomyces]|uniref:hypothetical protein n=1 Tax=unclassified Streptomyces TaxID=2593676 RepID=UPI00278BF2B4|nr:MULTISPECIES: hypothetical protein [unclassified Streptomyces]